MPGRFRASIGHPKNALVDVTRAALSPSPKNVVLTLGSPPSSGAVKWHPGHYVKSQGEPSATNQSAYWAAVFNNYMPKALESSNIKGILVEIPWGVWNTTGSTYDWNRPDSVVAWANTNNKYAIFKLTYKNFHSSVGLIGPADLISAGQYTVTNSGFLMNVKDAPIMDRFIASIQQFAARYNNNSRAEFITYTESATSVANTAYPRIPYAVQLKRLYAASGLAFTKTNVGAGLNSLSDELSGLLESAYQAKIGLATADAHDSIVETMVDGTTYPGEDPGPVRDYRGLIAHHTIASAPTLGGTHDNGPPSNIINWAQAKKVTHISWVTTVGLAGHTWTDIKAAIAADPLLYTACPLEYPGGCNTA